MEISSGTSREWLFVHCFLIELDFRDVGFLRGGGVTGLPDENPRSKARTNNKLDSLMMLGRNRIQTQASLVYGQCSTYWDTRAFRLQKLLSVFRWSLSLLTTFLFVFLFVSYMSALRITEHAGKRAKDLSGGTKRKVSICCSGFFQTIQLWLFQLWTILVLHCLVKAEFLLACCHTFLVM